MTIGRFRCAPPPTSSPRLVVSAVSRVATVATLLFPCVATLLCGCSFDVPGLQLSFTGSDGAPDDGSLTPDDGLAPGGDAALLEDLAARIDLLGVCANGRAPTHAGDLAEGDLTNWLGEAPMPWFGKIPPDLKVEADNKVTARGLISLRFTDTSDQGVLTYPRAKNAGWDLSAFDNLHASVAADDSAKQNDPGWQETDPHITLYTSAADYFAYVPDLNKLPRTPGTFITLSVPLTGGGGWSRTTQGNPSLANINYLSFSMDTFGFGFKLWLDAVTFEPGVFVDCTP